MVVVLNCFVRGVTYVLVLSVGLLFLGCMLCCLFVLCSLFCLL